MQTHSSNLIRPARGMVLALVCANALITGAGSAAEVSYTRSLGFNFTPWEEVLTLPRHNPALGTLQEVRLRFEAFNRANAIVENRDDVPREITISAVATIELLDGGFGLLATATPTVSYVNSLGAFDGTIDFEGESGAINPLEVVEQSQTLVWSGDLSAFVGGGELNFGLSASASLLISGADSFLGGGSVEAAVNLTMTYVYEGGETGVGGGLAGVAWVDADGDGVLSPGEGGLAGATVTVRNAAGSVVGTAVTGLTGGFEVGLLPAGEYELQVVPVGGDWIATADPDGLLTPGKALVTVVDGVVTTVDGYGFVTVSGPLPGEANPGFWANNQGLARVSPVHVAILNGLALVDRNGAAVDFSGDIGPVRLALQSFLRQGMARNEAGHLSQQLAAYALGLMHGRYEGVESLPVGSGVELSPLEILEQAAAALALDGFTPPKDPNRVVQKPWTEILRVLNGN
jgi:hypothetical protein